MKKKIDRKVYDTKKSIRIASGWPYPPTKMHLYQTQDGEFFTYEEIVYPPGYTPIHRVPKSLAKHFYKKMDRHFVSYEEAFGVELEEA